MFYFCFVHATEENRPRYNLLSSFKIWVYLLHAFINRRFRRPYIKRLNYKHIVWNLEFRGHSATDKSYSSCIRTEPYVIRFRKTIISAWLHGWKEARFFIRLLAFLSIKLFWIQLKHFIIEKQTLVWRGTVIWWQYNLANPSTKVLRSSEILSGIQILGVGGSTYNLLFPPPTSHRLPDR